MIEQKMSLLVDPTQTSSISPQLLVYFIFDFPSCLDQFCSFFVVFERRERKRIYLHENQISISPSFLDEHHSTFSLHIHGEQFLRDLFSTAQSESTNTRMAESAMAGHRLAFAISTAWLPPSCASALVRSTSHRPDRSLSNCSSVCSSFDTGMGHSKTFSNMQRSLCSLQSCADLGATSRRIWHHEDLLWPSARSALWQIIAITVLLSWPDRFEHRIRTKRFELNPTDARLHRRCSVRWARSWCALRTTKYRLSTRCLPREVALLPAGIECKRSESIE